uniref:Uncharacterized protein n=1 Tax=Arundo donax TaxID=35708 RepID=A0A0A9A7E0_ARUDO
MLCVVGSTDWEAQARRAQELTSSSPPADVENRGAHASAAEGARPEKGEQEADVEGRCYEPLISNSKEAEPETAA